MPRKKNQRQKTFNKNISLKFKMSELLTVIRIIKSDASTKINFNQTNSKTHADLVPNSNLTDK